MEAYNWALLPEEDLVRSLLTTPRLLRFQPLPL
jgi:hypothetical protein